MTPTGSSWPERQEHRYFVAFDPMQPYAILRRKTLAGLLIEWRHRVWQHFERGPIIVDVSHSVPALHATVERLSNQHPRSPDYVAYLQVDEQAPPRLAICDTLEYRGVEAGQYDVTWTLTQGDVLPFVGVTTWRVVMNRRERALDELWERSASVRQQCANLANLRPYP
jgi:hypothetical protein